MSALVPLDGWHVVCLVGSPHFADRAAVKWAVKKLPGNAMTLFGDESTVIEQCGVRQASCSLLLCAVFRAPRHATLPIGAAVAMRDRAMFELADDVIVFGTLPANREDVLSDVFAGRLDRIRRVE